MSHRCHMLTIIGLQEGAGFVVCVPHFRQGRICLGHDIPPSTIREWCWAGFYGQIIIS